MNHSYKAIFPFSFFLLIFMVGCKQDYKIKGPEVAVKKEPIPEESPPPAEDQAKSKIKTEAEEKKKIDEEKKTVALEEKEEPKEELPIEERQLEPMPGPVPDAPSKAPPKENSLSESKTIHHVQSFVIAPEERKVDILFVVDNSSSMSEEQKILSDSFSGFISEFLKKRINYHIGVLSTDARLSEKFAKGSDPLDYLWPEATYKNFSNSGAGSLLSLQKNDRYLTSKSHDISRQFKENTKLGTEGSGSEMALQSLIYALSPELVGAEAWNSNFFRDDALLSIIVVSDEDEVEAIGQKNYLFDNKEKMQERFKKFDELAMGIKSGRRGLLRVDAVIAPPDEECKGALAVGNAYAELTKIYRGSVANICKNFSPALSHLGDAIATQSESSFVLDKVPLSKLSVSLNGEKLEEGKDFYFNADTRSIQLSDQIISPLNEEAAKLELRYSTFAD